MSQDDPQDPTPPTPESPNRPPTVRFRQLCRLRGDTLLALSDEGVIYRRVEINEDTGEDIWRRLATISSTQFEMRQCAHPGCTDIETYPGDEDPRHLCKNHRQWRR